MATRHHNISGELTQELLAPGDDVTVSKISLTNTQKVSSCKVDLFIQKALMGKFYLIKGVEIPVGATLIYDDIKFRNATGEFGLYIKLTDGATFTLTGSINVTGSNTDVPGSGTAFLSEVSIGDEIVVDGETRVVTSIVGDDEMAVSVAWGGDLDDDTSPDCNPTALVDVIIN